MTDKLRSDYDSVKLTVYENSEKYVITNNLISNENHSRNSIDAQQKRMFLVFSKIKGTGEIMMIKDEYNTINHNSTCDKEVSHVYDDSYLDHFFKSNIFHKTYQIYSIYGLITLEGNTYLIFITEVEPIGQIDNQIIHKIKQVEIKELLITQPNNSYLLKRARDFFKYDGIYYSRYDLYSNTAYEYPNITEYEFMFNYKLIRSFLQLFEKDTIGNSSFSDQEDVSVKKLSDLSHISLPQPEDLLQKYAFLSHFIAKSIFGSYEAFTLCEHAQCSERKSCILHDWPYLTLSIEEQEKFLYGRSFHHESGIFDILKQRVKNNFNTPKQKRDNIIPKNSGDMIKSIPLNIPICPSFTIHLISRRSYNNMGARYLRRGIREGFPANSVETEQLIQVNHISNEYHDRNEISRAVLRKDTNEDVVYKSREHFHENEQINDPISDLDGIKNPTDTADRSMADPLNRSTANRSKRDSLNRNMAEQLDNSKAEQLDNGKAEPLDRGKSDTFNRSIAGQLDRSKAEQLYRGKTDTGMYEMSRLFNTRSHILSSFLQLRGSIPLCWKQDLSFKYTPNIKITKSYEPLTTYNSRISRHYRSVFYLNLIKSTGYESALNLFYCRSLQDNNLKYLHYDFNKEGLHFSKKKKRELLSLLRPLLRRNKHKMMIWNKNNQNCHKPEEIIRDHHNLDCTIPTVPTFQQGIIRTNCIDSLDRTNIVQYFIAEEMIQEQISAIVANHGKGRRGNTSLCYDKVHFTDEGYSISLQHMALLSQGLTNEGFHQKHKSLWIRNGHRLSRQYSGTNSLHSGAVAQFKKGSLTASNSFNDKSILSNSSLLQNGLIDNSRYVLARTLANDGLMVRYSVSFLSYRLNDLRYSIIRYFKNRFMHGDLQTTYDIITGSNMQMYRRKDRSFSLFHSFVCCTSVLFYMYYFVFYYGQDTNTDRSTTILNNLNGNMNSLKSGKSIDGIETPISDIENTISWIYSEETYRNILAIKNKIEPYLNERIRRIISDIIHKWRCYKMSTRIKKAFMMIHSIISIRCYDFILISVLSTIITLIVYLFILGNCFNLPFYE